MGKSQLTIVIERLLKEIPDDSEVWDFIGKTLDKRNTADLETIYGGFAMTWAECTNCGSNVQYPTDKPYVYCPYCRSRILYDKPTVKIVKDDCFDQYLDSLKET